MSDSRPRRTARDTGRSDAETAVERITPVVVPDVGFDAEPAAAAVEAPATMLPAAIPSVVEPSRISAEGAWARLSEAQLVLARGFEDATVQISGVTRSGFAAGADAAIALLGARTFAEVVEINAALIRRDVDAAFRGSTKLTEIGIRAVADASRLLLWGAAL